jgi:hypothetical protein
MKNGKTRQVFIAVASYSQKTCTAFTHSLLKTIPELSARGYTVHVETLCNDALIARARNTLLSVFYHRNYDDLVFIDDDMGWEDGAVSRLLDHPVELVGGLYPVRKDKEEYMLRWEEGKKTAQLDPANGLLEVDCIPTGFMRITRACAEKMINAYSERWYHEDSGAVEKSWAVFDCMMIDNRYWGEDFLFCQRWRKIGGRVWVDPWLKFKHVGEKVYEGCFGTYKRREVLARIAAEGRGEKVEPDASGNACPAPNLEGEVVVKGLQESPGKLSLEAISQDKRMEAAE